MSQHLSLLIAEDDEADANLLIRQFKQAGYTVTSERVQTAETYAQALNRQRWDIILADFSMPQFTALDALRLSKQSGQDIPFIIISGVINEEAAVEAMKSGAHDYFQKGKLTRLIQSAEREIREAQDRAKRRAAERNLQVLIETGQVLSSSLDYETTLRNVTSLLVPELADWCAVYLVEKGEIRQVALTHTNPDKIASLKVLSQEYPVDPNAPLGHPKVIRTGEPELIPEIPAEVIEKSAVDARHADLLKGIGLRSYICVPIKVRDEVLGAITIATAESGRTYDADDLTLAQAFAQRASVAIENALLYRDAAEQREWFEVTLSSIGDAVIATDIVGRISFMNSVAQTLTGWPLQEARDRSLDDVFRIVNEETFAPVESPVTKVMNSGLTVGLANHTVLIDKGGQSHPIDDSGAPIRDKQGNMIGVVLVFHDVSQQRHIERLIRESEERYRNFIENSSEGIWRFSLERPVSTTLSVDDQIDQFYECGYLAECNDAMARMYGYERAEEIVGARLGDLLPRQSQQNVDYLGEFIRAGYRLTDGESQEVDREGHTLYFLNNLVGTFEDSHIVGAWGIQRDITVLRESRLQLEAALTRTSELYQLSSQIGSMNTPTQVLESLLKSPLFSTAKRATVLWFDRPWIDGDEPEFGDILAAWNRDPNVPDLTGRRFVFADYQSPGLVSRDEPVIVTNVATDSRTIGSVKDYLIQMGTQSYVSLPLVAAGKLFGMLTTHWDYPDAISLPEVQYLRGISDQAAAAIYNLRLLEQEAQARQRAEQADALKMKFLAMISHELRTPLTSIKGFVSSLLAPDVTWGPEQEREFLSIVNVETDNLAELVEQLLDLSRLEAGALRINQAHVSVREIVDTALPQMMHLCANHTVRQDIPDGLPEVMADQRRIVQVLTNLIDNACKYSPAGTEVNLSARQEGDMIRFTVRDQGLGIPLEDRDAVFEAFRQAQNRPAHESRGAGLGLAITRALIEAHHGRIMIEEHQGQGTVISFTLPIARG